MTFWFGYVLGVVSMPVGILFTQALLDLFERWKGHTRMPGPRSTGATLAATAISAFGMFGLVGVCWWFLT